MAAGVPSGTVTFLFTDIVGSTRLWEREPDAAGLVASHDLLLRSAIDAHGGLVFSTAGDSFAAAFHTPADAVRAAVEAQRSAGGLPPVRMAIHAGPVEARGGGYFGPTLNRCGRLCEAAHGGQIVCSRAVADLLADHPIPEVGLVDLGEHRLRDLGRPELIHQIIHPDLPAVFPPLRTLTVDNTNLPIQLTSFIGRHQEIAEIEKLIHASRLVTLTGAGGCGKSRLAVEAAATLSDEFTDGVWVVELAALDDPSLITQTVASALTVREHPRIELTDTLLAYLERRTLLLILDNCEHLIDPAGRLVASILTRTPGVTILTTSRQPLHIRGEVIYRVSPLPLPDANADLHAIAHSDAIRLFVERAAAASSGFHLTGHNAATVASICTRVDGIPLAIELAAAMTPILSVEDMDERLGDRFRLLHHGDRSDLSHHRTLAAAIDWSYDHLTLAQQILFSRLGVFESGWTLEAAEAVCGGDQIETSDVITLLDDLIDRSLVTIAERTSTRRYRYLETIHGYARGQMHQTEETATAHARYFRRLAQRLNPPLYANRATEALDAFAADLDNFRAALDFLARSGRRDEYCRLLAELRRFLWIRRLYTESDRFYRNALDDLPDSLDPSTRGQILMGAGWNLTRAKAEDEETAVRLLHQAVSYLEQAGDDLHLSEALSYLTVLEDPSHAEAAHAAAARSGDKTAIGRPHHYVGVATYLRGAPHTALEHFEKAIAMVELPHLRGFALAWRAAALFRVGRVDDAAADCAAAVAIFESGTDPAGLETALSVLAQIALHRGEALTARHLTHRIVELKGDLGESVDRGTHAGGAHAAIRLGDVPSTIEQLASFLTATAVDVMVTERAHQAYPAVTLLALHHHDPATAAAALGAEHTYRATTLMRHIPREQDMQALELRVRALLPPEQFDAAWQQGTAMTLDELIHLALDRYSTTDVAATHTTPAETPRTSGP